MKIQDIFTTYWNQVILLLLGLGYLIKRVFDLRSKKSEINFNLFQQYRLNATNRFFSNFAKAELMWTHIAIYDIFSEKISVKDIDTLIFPSLNSLRESMHEVKIYYDKKTIELFEALESNMIQLNRLVSDLYFDYDPKKTVSIKANEYYFNKSKLEKENKITLDKIYNSVQNTFKH
ncbi:MAG: hypothetical protein V4613_02895 [Bacteroidota bacterium]